MDRFVAIDFETANEDRATACAVGWATVDDGVIRNSGWTPIDPEIEDNDWADFYSVIHGFRPADVRGAPTFPDAWAQVDVIASSLPLVAHHASFDLSVIRAELARYEVTPTPIRYACSALLARAAWPTLLGASLTMVARQAGVAVRDRSPEANAVTSAEITVQAIPALGQRDLGSAIHTAGLVWGSVDPDLT